MIALMVCRDSEEDESKDSSLMNLEFHLPERLLNMTVSSEIILAEKLQKAITKVIDEHNWNEQRIIKKV